MRIAYLSICYTAHVYKSVRHVTCRIKRADRFSNSFHADLKRIQLVQLLHYKPEPSLLLAVRPRDVRMYRTHTETHSLQRLKPLEGFITLTTEPCCVTFEGDPATIRAKMPCGCAIGKCRLYRFVTLVCVIYQYIMCQITNATKLTKIQPHTTEKLKQE